MAVFKSISLADQVFEKLESDIIAGVYPRGEVLTELKLVEQLNVSRTPIREALRRLEQERLIRDSGKGSVVLGITLEDLEDIMDIRLRCEGLAAFYAAKTAPRPMPSVCGSSANCRTSILKKETTIISGRSTTSSTRASTKSAAAPCSWTPCAPCTGKPSATAAIPTPSPPGGKRASTSTRLSATPSATATRNWRNSW